MKNKCKTCNEGPLADWERELHDSWHEVHDPKPETPGFWQSLMWGVFLAIPFIAIGWLIWVMYS